MARFTLIDGLRGIASLSVAVFHLSLAVEPALGKEPPKVIDYILGFGHWGVEIFFVISGFVIAYSIRDATFTFKYLGKFSLRRSIRLDPPYLLVILIELLLIKVSLFYFPELGTKLPTTEQLIAHLFYLQGLLGLGSLVPIFWTLCYEVQFYLFLVSILVFYHTLRRLLNNSRYITLIILPMALLLYIYSIAIFLEMVPASLNGLFIDRWYQFSLGALAWWSSKNSKSWWVFPAIWTLSLAFTMLAHTTNLYRIESTIVILITSMLVFIGAVSGNLTRWLNSPMLLFFGTISYGLYLLHLSIGWRLIALERKILGDDVSLLVGFLMLLSGLIISIFSAWLLHLVVERPAMNLAHRVKLPKVEVAPQI